MRKLIDAGQITALVNEGKKVLYIDPDTLITPYAKDLIKTNGVEVITGKEPEVVCVEKSPVNCDCKDIDANVLFSVFSKLSAAGLFNAPAASSNDPYISEKDKTNFKVVRGHSVCTTTLETGNPADNGKVQYQEIIGAGDSSPVNAGFMTIEACSFDWDVVVHEVYYVVCGSISVTIDGKTYVANQGDSLYIPKGIKCVFGAKENVKVFYVTY